jgi:hypothetical protein
MDFSALTIWAFVAAGLSRVSSPPSNSFNRNGTRSVLMACRKSILHHYHPAVYSLVNHYCLHVCFPFASEHTLSFVSNM